MSPHSANTATLEDLLATVQSLNAEQSTRSLTRKFVIRIEPLISFIDRYAKAADIMCQSLPLASLIWGSLRFLLESASSASLYFQKLLDVLERLGTHVHLYRRYEELFENVESFNRALAYTQLGILDILRKACVIFRKKRFSLLLHVSWRNFESDFRESLVRMDRHMRMLDDEITLSHRKRVQAHLATISQNNAAEFNSTDSLRDKILAWIAPYDVASDLERYGAKRFENTGTWILEHSDFQDWRGAKTSPMLWLYGGSGSGKTVLSAFVIQQLLDITGSASGVTSFFFFDRTNASRQSLTTLIATIIGRLLLRQDTIDSSLIRAYETSRRSGRSCISQLDHPRRLLQPMISAQSRLYIVIDGLDECDDLAEVSTFLKEVSEKAVNVRTMVFSRDVPRIRSALDACPQIRLHATHTREDIDRYIGGSVARLMLGDAALEHSIVKTISAKAEGMFLWAARTIESLHVATTPAQVLRLIDELPPGIDDYYNHFLQNMWNEHVHRRMLSGTVLKWVCCAARPLTWNEMQHVLANLGSERCERELRKPFKSVVLHLCGAFVAMDDNDQTLRLHHLSAREFLLKQPTTLDTPRFVLREAEVHSEIAVACLQCLLNQPSEAIFLEYATLYWQDHLLKSSHSENLQALLVSFARKPATIENWVFDLLAWPQQPGFAMSKILGPQVLLNDWMQCPVVLGTHNRIDWTDSLINVLLNATSPECPKIKENLVLRLSYFEKMMIVRYIARVLTQSKRLVGGIERFEMELRERATSEVSLEHCWILSTLGILYDQQKEVRRSLRLHSRVLVMQQSALPCDSPEALWTVNELGRVYRHLGEYAQAERMHEHALKGLRSTLADDHPEVVWTVNTLARAYRKHAKLADALHCHQKALAQQKRSLGVTHPDTLWTTGDIGKCHRGLGCLDEATNFHRKSLEGRKVSLGSAHVDTLWSMSKLGQVLAERGDIEAAVSLLEEALDGQTSTLGSQDAQTRKTARALEDAIGSGSKSVIERDVVRTVTRLSRWDEDDVTVY